LLFFPGNASGFLNIAVRKRSAGFRKGNSSTFKGCKVPWELPRSLGGPFKALEALHSAMVKIFLQFRINLFKTSILNS
jgi:hypothetical protein